MTRTDYRLFAALALSLTLHLLPFVPNFDFGQKKPPTVASMVAELRPPPAAPSAPPLTLPEQPRQATTDRPRTDAQAKSSTPRLEPKATARAQKTWTEAVLDHMKKLDAAGQFYPAEAIAQGLQGEVDVLLVLDETGKVVAARVEQGSGHEILDAAALRAVRSLKSLPTDTPRQVLLPVRFRLR